MGKFFDETMQGLLEAVEIEKGSIPLIQKENMPARTLMGCSNEKELISQMINIRKKQNLPQKQLAEIIGTKQQAISRIEKNEHSPSLHTFCNILNILGYKLVITKK